MRNEGMTEGARIGEQYLQVLARPADQWGMPYLQDSMGNGWSLSDTRFVLAHSDEAAARIDDIYRQTLNRGAEGSAISGLQNALSSGDTLQAIRWRGAHSIESSINLEALFNSYAGSNAAPFALAYEEALLGTGYSFGDVNTQLLALVAEPVPTIAFPPAGTQIAPYNDRIPVPGDVPIAARQMLSYRSFIYYPQTGAYQVIFHFPNSMEAIPTFNQRGSTPGDTEVGFYIVAPGSSIPSPGQNPVNGIRVGFSSYHRDSPLYQKPYFILYANGQAISPVTGRTVPAAKSHYPIDLLSSMTSYMLRN